MLEKIRREASGFVHRGVVGERDGGQKLIPVLLVDRYPFCHETVHRVVESFDSPVGRRLVGRGSDLVDREQFAEFLEELGFEVASSVCENLAGTAMATDYVIINPFGHGVSILISNGDQFNPFREMIDDC